MVESGSILEVDVTSGGLSEIDYREPTNLTYGLWYAPAGVFAARPRTVVA